MTWILKSYSAAPVMNNRSILARLARLIICSVHMHLKTFIFWRFTTGGSRVGFCLQSGRLHVSTRRKKNISALLMINVLIFLDMVWFGFLIFTHYDDDAFRSFLRCLCHIEVCVAVQRLITSFAINWPEWGGWMVVELQNLFSVFPTCFKSKSTYICKSKKV